MFLTRFRWLLLALLLLVGCEMRFGTPPTATPAPTDPPPAPVAVVVWAQGGDLLLWRADAPVPRVLASGAVIAPFLSADAARVTFTRGAQGDARALWSVNADGTGEAELVAPDVLPSLRGGHPQVNQVGWLGLEAVYFNTLQDTASGTAQSDNLYRAEPGAPPRLVLPPGAGGNFAISPDGQTIAVTAPGAYDIQKGRVSLLDPLGVTVRDALSFTAVNAPNEPPFYLPLAWNAESTFLRVPVPSRESDRVALWRVPVDGEAQIFGYISALRDGLPVWSRRPFPAEDQMLYLNDTDAGAVELILARANGENPQVYDSGPYSAGGISAFRWLPDGERFAYERGGALWLGRTGQPPALVLSPTPERIVFLADGTFVYLASDELRLGEYADGIMQSSLIAALPSGTLFDAGVTP